MQHSYEERLEETAGKMQDSRQELTAAKSYMSTLETSLHTAEASCMKAQEHAAHLRGQLQSATSTAESAQSKAQQLEAETVDLRKAVKVGMVAPALQYPLNTVQCSHNAMRSGPSQAVQ